MLGVAVMLHGVKVLAGECRLGLVLNQGSLRSQCPRLVSEKMAGGLPVKSQRSRRSVVMSMGPVPGAGLSEELKDALDDFVSKTKVVAFIKGTKEFPQCGFSHTVVQILNIMETPFETVNILEDDMLRQGMKEYSQWPTFPQVYIDGEFYGGCDIMIEAYQSGELKETLERALNS